MSAAPEAVAVAWSWVEHLRAGGTTPWADWRDRGEGSHLATRSEEPLPGAAQLELLRRVNAAAGGRPLGELAARILRRPAPGRGAVEFALRLAGDRDGDSRRSAPPVDPSDVPVPELLRVCAGVVADLLVEGCGTVTPAGDATRAPRAPRAVRAARRLRLGLPTPRQGRDVWVEGPPESAARMRRLLADAGVRLHRPRRARDGVRTSPGLVVLLALPLERGLFEVWSARSRRGGARRWETWVGEVRHHGVPPLSLRARRTALFWAERIGAERVHVFASDGSVAAERSVVATVAGLVGGRGADPTTTLPDPLPPAAVDALRRVNGVLAVHCAEPERGRLADRLADELGAAGAERPQRPSAPRLRVPPEHLAWVSVTASRIAAGLSGGGYPVHGDLAVLVPPPQRSGDLHTIDPTEVLALMAQVLLRRGGRS